MKRETLVLRPVTEHDIKMLEFWLNQDYILKWYHDPEAWMTEIKGRQNAYSWIHHFIVMEGQTPVGFCQYYDCYDAKDLEDWYTVTEAGDTFSIDYLIGNKAYLHGGYGKRIVALLTHTIQSKENPGRIIVQPEQENHASNHVLLANGYLYDEQWSYYYKQFS